MNFELLNVVMPIITFIIGYVGGYIIISKLADLGKMDRIFNAMDKIANKLNPNYDIEKKVEKLKFVCKANAYHDSHYRVRVFIGAGNMLLSPDFNTLNRFLKRRRYNLEWVQYFRIEPYDRWIFGDKYEEGITLCLLYTRGGK